jgi:hypothetical protein
MKWDRFKSFSRSLRLPKHSTFANFRNLPISSLPVNIFQLTDPISGRTMKRTLLMALAFILVAQSASAQLIVNSSLPIVERVNVRVIPVANNDGLSPAPLFGTAPQQANIFSFVDTIWSQAGIDVNFTFAPTIYNNSFANFGTPGNNNPRPTGDLNTIISSANSAGGILDPDPNTLNLFMVNIVPGFPQTNEFTTNGLAFINGNGMAFWAGPELPTFGAGQEVIASVLSHEIGHNLGLDHITEPENLMQAGGSSFPGERLNAVQIATALNSPYTVPVPEPLMTPALIAIGVFAWRRRVASKKQ